MMPDLDRSLYDELHHQTQQIRVPSGDLDGVVARGRSRRRRYRAGVSLTAVVAAGAVAGGVLSHTGGGGPATTRVQYGTTGGGAPAPADPTLRWRTVSASDGLGYATSLTAGATQYALSTGPSTAADPQSEANVLWRSTDGHTWQQAATPAGLSLDDVAGSGGTVYAVGTGPATAAEGTGPLAGGVQVASNAGGSTWAQTKLPLRLSDAGGALTVNNSIVKVAAGAGGVVAAVTPGVTVNVGKLLPAGTAVTHWAVTPGGIDLLGAQKANACPAGTSDEPPLPATAKSGAGALSAAAAQKLKLGLARKAATPAPSGPDSPQVNSVECFGAGGQATAVPVTQAYPVTATYSWAQLHLSATEVAEIEGDTVAFYSADGRSFHQVTIPSGSGAIQSLTASAGGFVLATENGVSGIPDVFSSADGTHWTAHPLPSDVDGVAGAGEAGGQLVAFAQGDGSVEVLTLSGGTWAPVAIPGFAPQAAGKGVEVDQVAFGGAGVAAVATTSGKGADTTPTTQVLYSPNGANWSATNLATASGGGVGTVDSLAVGAANVTVTLQRPLSTPAGTPAPLVIEGTPAAAR